MSRYAAPYDAPERQIDPDCEAPRFFAVRGVNMDCQACDIADTLALDAGCGDDWFCSAPCKVEGSHLGRETRICLHHAIRVIS